MSTPLQPWEIDLVRQLLSGKVIDARGRRVVNASSGLFTGDLTTSDQLDGLGGEIATELTRFVDKFSTDIVFSATDSDTVAWTAGSIRFFDGTVASISAGNTGNMTALTYIIYHPDISTTVLQVSTSFAAAVGTNDRILLCVASKALDATQKAFFVPSIGVFGINETVIGPNSITAAVIKAATITANEIAANTITAANINVASLSAISISAFLISGEVIQGAIIRTAASGTGIYLDSTNGLRAFSGGTLVSQIPVSGGTVGSILTSLVQSINTALILQEYAGKQQITLFADTAQKIEITTNFVLRMTINNSGITASNGGFIGDGSGLTSLPAGNLTGTVADARLTSNVPLKNASNTFSAAQTISSGGLTITSANISMSSGFGIASGSTSFEVNSSYVRAYHSSNVVLEINNTDAKIMIGGVLYTLSVIAGVVNAA